MLKLRCSARACRIWNIGSGSSIVALMSNSVVRPSWFRECYGRHLDKGMAGRAGADKSPLVRDPLAGALAPKRTGPAVRPTPSLDQMVRGQIRNVTETKRVRGKEPDQIGPSPLRTRTEPLTNFGVHAAVRIP
jgi:hypothetical protein